MAKASDDPMGGDHQYAIALGSNRRHGRFGAPAAVISAAIAQLAMTSGITPIIASPIIHSAAIGPSRRQYANAALCITSSLAPDALLVQLKQIERAFGRRPSQRWAARVIDLDILLWSGGIWLDRALVIPHPMMAQRRFVLDPLVRIAPALRVPMRALARTPGQSAMAMQTVRQLHDRCRRAKPAARNLFTKD